MSDYPSPCMSRVYNACKSSIKRIKALKFAPIRNKSAVLFRLNKRYPEKHVNVLLFNYFMRNITSDPIKGTKP